MLLESRVDVALVEGPVSDQRVTVQPWRDDELIVIAPPSHPLTKSPRTTVSMLADEAVLVREPGSGTRVVTERALAAQSVRLTNTMRVGGTEAIKQAVAAGLGLAIVSRAAAADQLALGRVTELPIEGLTIRRTLAQIKLQGRAVTASARELETLLAEPLDEMPSPR
jgi:DNA-binding transcriptional LysR family regulator